nr:MAG TPA: major capsid protein [Caudoviricetes sp.]
MVDLVIDVLRKGLKQHCWIQLFLRTGHVRSSRKPKDKELATRNSCYKFTLHSGNSGRKKIMSFKTIESQEELDAIIGDRIERAKSSVRKEYDEKYKDYDDLKNQASQFETFKSESEKTINELNEKLSTVDELEKKNKQLETNSLKVKIAMENGIPYNLALRLNGNDEKSILEDAKNMAQYLGGQKVVAPLKKNEKKEQDNPYKKLLDGLKNEKE